MQQGASIKGKCLSEATTHTNNTPSPLPSRFPPSPLDLEECWKVSCHQHFPAALSELGGGGGIFLPSGHPAKNNSRLQQVGTGRERLEPDLQSDARRARARFIGEVSGEA